METLEVRDYNDGPDNVTFFFVVWIAGLLFGVGAWWFALWMVFG